MRTDAPSRTAFLAAMSRARHQVQDGGRVFPDPLALRIIGKEAALEITSASGRESRVSRALRGPLVARSRMAEDTLRAAVASGARQYVLLGAGLDTFPYRNPFPADTLRVFEVDHPATQTWKRGLLKENGIEVPGSVTFVPVDFEAEDFTAKLRAAGFDPALPTVYSWLGVTMYLPPERVMQVLKTIADSSATGSVVVFDYVGQPARWNLPRRAILAMLSRRFARMGEPWLCFLDDRRLANDLLALGYRKVQETSTEQIADELFAPHGVALKHRRSGRNFAGVMKAWV